MNMENENKSFLGKGWSFPPEFSEKGKINMVTDDEDIRQSLSVLLDTSPGERVHRPQFGCNLRAFLYEPMSTSTQARMKDEIEKAVLLFEPRIMVDHISFSSESDNILLITLDYTIRQTNRRSNMVYPFYLGEGTDL